MENKYHRQILPQDKLNALQSVWKNQKTVKQVCQELLITKQTYYQWERKALEEMARGVIPKKPGRHPRDYIAPPEMDSSIKKLKRDNQRLMKEQKLLQRQTRQIEGDLKIARIIINNVLPRIQDAKKNGVTPEKPS